MQARKTYSCLYCDKPILKGDSYRRTTAGRKHHLECRQRAHATIPTATRRAVIDWAWKRSHHKAMRDECNKIYRELGTLKQLAKRLQVPASSVGNIVQHQRAKARS